MGTESSPAPGKDVLIVPEWTWRTRVLMSRAAWNLCRYLVASAFVMVGWTNHSLNIVMLRISARALIWFSKLEMGAYSSGAHNRSITVLHLKDYPTLVVVELTKCNPLWQKELCLRNCWVYIRFASTLVLKSQSR